MSELTVNYNFNLPVIGGSDNTWATNYTTEDPLTEPSPGLNGNWSKTDALLKAMEDRLAAVEASYQIPVGGLYFSVAVGDDTAAKVATRLGYGTWAAYGEGRVLTAVGSNGESTVTRDVGYGQDNRAITTTHLPAHTHGVGTYSVGTFNDSFAFTLRDNDSGNAIVSESDDRVSLSNNTNEANEIDTTGNDRDQTKVTVSLNHNHALYGSSSSTGSGNSFGLRQRGIGILVYKRTA